MRLGGLQKLTLVDFPGKIAATIFTQGCNFRCRYCHNAQLVLPQFFQEPLPLEHVLAYLSERQGKLEGVVITGGEPTLQKGLVDFIIQIKDLGFAVKLDTNGSHPEVLSTLFNLKLLDYVAMDIKTSLSKYIQLVGGDCEIQKIKKSISIIINSGIPYQFRTTLIKEFCAENDLKEIGQLIPEANHYVLQPFMRSAKMVDSKFSFQGQYSISELEALKLNFEKYGDKSSFEEGNEN